YMRPSTDTDARSSTRTEVPLMRPPLVGERMMIWALAPCGITTSPAGLALVAGDFGGESLSLRGFDGVDLVPSVSFFSSGFDRNFNLRIRTFPDVKTSMSQIDLGTLKSFRLKENWTWICHCHCPDGGECTMVPSRATWGIRAWRCEPRSLQSERKFPCRPRSRGKTIGKIEEYPRISLVTSRLVAARLPSTGFSIKRQTFVLGEAKNELEDVG